MEIKFSRHAKRRAKLYEISEKTITDILTKMNLHQGEHEIITDVPGFKYPLKIVVSIEGNLMTVITNYPLKKRRKK
jgi:HSP20 family molecular chaperone IbpA